MMPFENVRIADFTTMLAGAGICRELADLGADVIKIEPVDGDPYRMMGASFLSLNRNKRAIVIDLRKDDARDIAYRVISSCTMLVENSRPGSGPVPSASWRWQRRHVLLVSLCRSACDAACGHHQGRA